MRKAKEEGFVGQVFEVTNEMAAAAYDPPAKIGDNRLLGVEQKKLLQGYLQELDRIKGEQDHLKEEEKDVFQALKEKGFDAKVVKQMRKLLEMEAGEREEYLTSLEIYLHGAGHARPGME